MSEARWWRLDDGSWGVCVHRRPVRPGAVVGVAKRDANRGDTDEVTIDQVIRTWDEGGELRSLCSVIKPPLRWAPK